jgi:superfamily I DNA and RNA helicase
MDFLPGSIGITGNEQEVQAFSVIQEALSDHSGQIGYRLPSIGIGDKDFIPSFVCIVDESCILLIDIVFNKVVDVKEDGEFWIYENGDDSTSRDLIIDRFEIEVKNRLKEDNRLHNRRDNTFKVSVIKLLIFCNNTKKELDKFYDSGLIINSFNSIEKLLPTIKNVVKENTFPAELSDNLYSLLEGTKAFEKKEKTSSVKDFKTLSDFANRSLINTFKLDQEQRKVSMQLPSGPQRIRGLAGTGKTVILALKAALTHKDLSDFKILFVFNTQSMYNQIRNLVSKYYIYENRKEPNWNNLEILHAWGGSSKQGFYSKTCKDFNIAAYRWQDVRTTKDPYEFIFRDLLNKIKKIKFEPIYDMVLIDEAQDFPQPFFELIYLLTKKPKRIIWAYDEFQSMNELRIKEPEELFGLNESEEPNIRNTDLNGQYVGGIDKDFILPKSYRNPRIALMTAHGIGLGLYRKEGIIDILSDRKSWRALGYKVESPNKEEYTEDDKMVIERPDENNKNILEGLLKENGHSDRELFTFHKFKTKQEEYKFVVQEISRLINKEGFKPEQIIVISLASTKTNDIFSFLRQLLDSFKIKCITPGFIENSDKFQEPGFVTLTTPFRAKGNEAEVVFVIDAENIISSYSFRARNAAFVSITRSRGWSYVVGSGTKMTDLDSELAELFKSYPKFNFSFPSEEEIKRRRIVFSKNSNEMEKSGLFLDRIIDENPELLIEILKNRPDLVSRIKNKNDSRSN